MATRINLSTSAQLEIFTQQTEEALRRVDGALDSGDRRLFRLWSARYRDVTCRCAALLLTIATTEA